MKKTVLLVFLLILITFFPRLLLAVNFFGTYDSANAIRLVNMLFDGKNIYIEGQYAYPPFWMGIMYLLKLISIFSKIPLFVLIRIPAIAADCFIVILIFKVIQKRSNNYEGAIISALLYALNPVALLISGYHGQLDSVWIAFALWAYYVFHFFSKSKRNLLLSASLLSLGIALKVFPIFFIPLFCWRIKENKSKYIFTLVSLAPLLLSMVMPFLTSFDHVFFNFVNYSQERNFWGISLIVGALHALFTNDVFIKILNLISVKRQFERIPLYLFLVFTYMSIYRGRKIISLPSGMLLIVCSILLFTPFFSIQWWIWVVPFCILTSCNKRYLNIYTFLVAIILILRYYVWQYQAPAEFHFLPLVDSMTALKIDLLNKILGFLVWVVLWYIYLQHLKMTTKNRIGILRRD